MRLGNHKRDSTLALATVCVLVVALALLPAFHSVSHSDPDHSTDDDCVVCHLITGGVEAPAALIQMAAPRNSDHVVPAAMIALYPAPHRHAGGPRGPPSESAQSV